MKRWLIVAITTLLLVGMVSTVMAETELKIDGQVRVRSEGERKSFDTNQSHMQVASFMRTRVGLTALVDDNAVGFVQFQDTRKLGGSDQFDNYQSGTLNDGKNVDIHQAYIKVKRVFADGFGMQLGRFEVNLGNQRVFGSVDWNNVGRSWEGFIGWYDKPEEFKINLFWLKKNEKDFAGYNGDFDIYGVYASIKKINLDIFAFVEIDSDTTFLAEDVTMLSRNNFGLFYQRKTAQLDFELTGVYQFGTQATSFLTAIPVAVEDDISALMFAFEGGYTFDNDRFMRAAVGFDYTSGDDEADLDYKTYDNLYYTGHKFRGYMDYFIAQPSAGLIDIYGRFQFDFVEGWQAMADLHYFSTAADYTYMSQDTKDVGIEIDLSVKTKKIKGIDSQWGFSYFSAKESFAGFEDAQSGIWIYEQFTLNF